MSGYGFSALRDGTNERKFSGLSYPFATLPLVENTASFQLYENSGTVQFNAESPGKILSYSFDVPKTDTYEIDLRPFRATSYGIYAIKIDGTTVKTLDFYGTSGASSKVEVLADLPLTEGSHVITFEGVGKREGATNYKLGIIQLLLYDEASKVIKNDPNNVNSTRDVWMYFGRNTGHGHKDTLNLGLHAFGFDLMPELGYPEYADYTVPRRSEWENNTISHNTVVVDGKKQGDQVVGQPRHFDDAEQVKLIDVEAPNVYPQTELYKRTTAMIQVDPLNSYAIDFFRIKGATITTSASMRPMPSSRRRA
ncbi:heparinase II/III family protein [Paenibacillus sp. CC-CFT747]|nr:heparinase II/III family protein [Paenibacillus sp. CC-CFT747]